MIEHETLKPDDNLVDRATAALRDMPVPDGPSEELLARTWAAVASAELAGPSHRDVTHYTSSKRRILTMKFATKLAIAAVLALFIGVFVWTGGPWGGQAAFADVLQKVNQVRSVRFKAVATVDHPSLPAGAPKTHEMTMTIVGERLRQESFGAVTFMDFKAGQTLVLTPSIKRAVRMTMQNVPAEVRQQNLLEQFRNMEADKGKPIGRQEIDGKPADGFRVEQGPQIVTVWADRKTRLPVRIEASVNVSMMPRSEVVMSDFQWDVPVDESTMAMEVPAGYQVQEMSMDLSEATEKDLLEALRSVAKLNGGKFPDTFDISGVTQAVTKSLMGEKKAGEMPQEKKQAMLQDLTQTMTEQMTRLGRAMLFIQPKHGEDFRYSGKGAELGQAGRAVFWYRPVKSETYHVIDADLTVHQGVKAEDLPKIEAQELTAPPQSSFPGKTSSPLPSRPN